MKIKIIEKFVTPSKIEFDTEKEAINKIEDEFLECIDKAIWDDNSILNRWKFIQLLKNAFPNLESMKKLVDKLIKIIYY